MPGCTAELPAASHTYSPHTTALGLSERVGDPALSTLVLDHLGIALTHAGRLVDAKERFGRCVMSHRTSGESSRLGVTLNNLADTHRQLGEYAEARRCLFESLQLRQALGDHLGIGVTTLSIGQVYAEAGRTDDALEWLTAAHAAGRAGEARADLLAALELSESVGDADGADEVRGPLRATQGGNTFVSKVER